MAVEWETETQRLERCDHEGTTEPFGDLDSILFCTICEKTWPTRFGAGAPTVQMIEKQSD